MPRAMRDRGESDVYHIIVRGDGRRILFEDDEDRECFLRLLAKALDSYAATAYAWCLMSNHVHVLARVDFDRMPHMMQSITSGYAVYFNKKYNHVGHVFCGRYNSKPIDDDEYLLQVVRYIHLNPVKDGLSSAPSYKWSSYSDYLNGTGFVDTSFVLDVCGGLQQFETYHEDLAADQFLDVGMPRPRLADSVAKAVAADVLGEGGLAVLASRAKAERDEGVIALRRAGLSARQVERFTGISRGIVERIKWR